MDKHLSPFGSARTAVSYNRGTQRGVAPEITLDRIRPFMREAGITRVANITGLDRIGIWTFAVCRPNSCSICVAQGKGVSRAAAMVSGIMEAVEGFHAENIVQPVRLAAQRELERCQIRSSVAGLPRVNALDFTEDARILWIEAVEYPSAQARVWVPFESVHTDYRIPFPSGSGRFLMSSNGLASGNSQVEATCHGIYELIERDATTLWLNAGGPALEHTRLRLGTVDNEVCLELLERFERAQVAVVVWDITSDVGIPAFLCQIADREVIGIRPLGPRRGMGCHPDRGIALARALTEAAQTRLTTISGARDDLSRHRYDAAAEEARRKAFVEMWSKEALREYSEIASCESQYFERDLEYVVDQLRKVGLDQVLVVDLCRPGWPISVVRVVVPGLEPMNDCPGYKPGKRAIVRLDAS